MAKPEEVLQKVNDYCAEKQYTLNDDFRSRFSDKFAGNNADADINDENIINSIKFNLDTAFSAASKELKINSEAWKTKESEYLKQIETLKKAHHEGDGNGGVKAEPPKFELTDDIKNQLNELNKFKIEKQTQEKRAKVLEIAQKSVREDLRGKLEDLLGIMQIDYSKDAKELATQLNDSFVKIYKDQIGNVKPQSPDNKSKMYEKILESAPKIKI